MTAAIAAGRRFLPRGYADFARQLLIWFGFLVAYQAARGVADRDPTRAFANGQSVTEPGTPGLVRVYGADGALLGIGVRRGALLKPERLLHADTPRSRVLPA